MASLEDYKNLQILNPDPTGPAGLAWQNNFKTIADALETMSGGQSGISGYSGVPSCADTFTLLLTDALIIDPPPVYVATLARTDFFTWSYSGIYGNASITTDGGNWILSYGDSFDPIVYSAPRDVFPCPPSSLAAWTLSDGGELLNYQPTDIRSGYGITGTSGSSGRSGYSGKSGASGKSGSSGSSGIGTSGSSGVSGASGASLSGMSGLSGYSGFNGQPGGDGLAGRDGLDGATGATGASGKSGYSGSSGRSGMSGFSGGSTSGISGYSGCSGFSGANGSSGTSGYSGTPAGSNTYVQFNDSGSFGGHSGIIYNKSTSALTVLTKVTTPKVSAGANTLILEGASTSAYFYLDWTSPYGVAMGAGNTSGTNIQFAGALQASSGIYVNTYGSCSLASPSWNTGTFTPMWLNLATQVNATSNGTLGYVTIGADPTTANRRMSDYVSDPTFRIYAGGTTNATDYVQFWHDQTDGQIKVGRGNLNIDSGGVYLKNVGSVPSTPTGGGVMYIESGALKYKGSSGTVTIMGAA